MGMEIATWWVPPPRGTGQGPPPPPGPDDHARLRGDGVPPLLKWRWGTVVVGIHLRGSEEGTNTVVGGGPGLVEEISEYKMSSSTVYVI